MGSLLVASIAAMTSVMTLIQLVVLALTLPVSPAPIAGEGGSQEAVLVAVKSDKKTEERAISPKASVKRARRHRAHHAHAHHAASKG